MDQRVDDELRTQAERFLRGDLSVPELTAAVDARVADVVEVRRLRGLEINLSALLEEWAQTDWDARIPVAVRIRSVCRRILDER